MGSVNDHIPGRFEFALKSQSGTYTDTYDKAQFALSGAYINPLCVRYHPTARFLPGANIGFKGFSWGFDENQTPVEMRHKGGVIIGKYVEVGSNNTIMRATLEGVDTVIGDYVKMDSLVHIAHNCVIEDRVIFTAGAILGGSVTIGSRAWLGLNCTIMNGVKIGKNSIIGVGAVVIRDVPANAVMAGNPARILRYRNA